MCISRYRQMQKISSKIGIYIIAIMASFHMNIALSGQQIIIDENFEEWENPMSRIFDETKDNPSGEPDILSLSLNNDENYLFVHFTLDREINLKEDYAMTIYIDIDNNTTTGDLKSGLGVDLRYFFNLGYGRLQIGNNISNIFHEDIQFSSAPTVSSKQFELAISRQSLGLYEMGATISLALLNNSNNGDKIPSTSGGLVYTFTNNLFIDQAVVFSKSPNTDFRLLTYNVQRDNVFDADVEPSFGKIIQAIRPDVMAFQEIYDHTSAQTKNLVEKYIPVSPSGTWHHVKINPDIILVSRFPILEYTVANGNGIFKLNIEDKEVIIVNVHLPCCENNSDRQQEVDNILSKLRSAKEQSSSFKIKEQSPIIICGDTNFVGDKQNAISLITGNIINENAYGQDLIPDWDGSNFMDIKFNIPHRPFTYTWYNASSSFSPGRLDYMLYSSSVLDYLNGFSLFTPTLTENELREHELQDYDALLASDHLPVFADFKFKVVSSTESTDFLTQQVSLYPNPTHGEFIIEAPDQVSIQEVNIYNSQSQLIAMKSTGSKDASLFSLKIDATPGLYYCKVRTDMGVIVKRVVVY